MKVIILAGGSGTRLFPLSRKCKPKQFLSVDGQTSLLSNTILRYLGFGVEASDITIVTADEYQDMVKAELEELGFDGIILAVEKASKGTMAAVVSAFTYLHDVQGVSMDETFLVTPADGHIEDEELFFQGLEAGFLAAQDDKIVAFGSEAESADIGYGYLSNALGFPAEFVEKPSQAVADYLYVRNWLWNMGVYIFKGTVFVQEALKAGYPILEGWDNLPSGSIEYNLIEHLLPVEEKLVAIDATDCIWRDVGSLFAFADACMGNDDVYEHRMLVDCKDVSVLTNNKQIVCVGMENTLVIDTPDVTMIIDKNKKELVDKAVSMLREHCENDSIGGVFVEESWGKYRILSEGVGYQVRELVINAGKCLAPHMHEKHSEMYQVVSGFLGMSLRYSREAIYARMQTVLVPQGWEHRLDNAGTVPLRIVEFRCGEDVSDGDICLLKERGEDDEGVDSEV